MITTRTFVELEISREAYLEIYTLLANAGHYHTFAGGAIDMHGIVLTKGKSKALAAFYCCTYCGAIEVKECEVVCWTCGKGEMEYIRPTVEVPSNSTSVTEATQK